MARVRQSLRQRQPQHHLRRCRRPRRPLRLPLYPPHPLLAPHANPTPARTRATATGPKNRILHEDVQNFVKQAMTGAAPAAAGAVTDGALNLLPWPKVDFAKFGPFEARPPSRIKKISGA